MRSFQALFRLMWVVFCSATAFVCAEVTQPRNSTTLVNERLYLFETPDESLDAEGAYQAFKQGAFTPNTANKVSLGFSRLTVWALLPVENLSQQSEHRVFKIDNAWLDTINVYIVTNDELVYQESIGDSEPFTQRKRSTRMPSTEYDFPVGVSYVLFQFISQDPMTIPIYMGSESAMVSAFAENAYFYGALYGGLLVLLIYNLALYLYLREIRYLLYPAYLFAFTAFNFTYTGHGFWLVWPNSVTLQQWMMPTLMYFYIASAFIFTLGYLNTRSYLPALYENRWWIYKSLIALAGLLVIVGDQMLTVMIQLAVLNVISVWMIVVGYFAFRNKDPLAKFFIPAILMGTGGATISSLATWGVIPYSQWAFRGIEIGMLLEMSLLSISLGFNFKLAQEARKSAENNARHDPLTGLFNRRAFLELVHPSWELGKRNNTPMSILLMDLDWFKRINDTFGHAAGDEVLERVAKEIKNRVRDSDIPLRWGGEEFLIFLPNTNNDQAKQLAEELRKNIEHVNAPDGGSVTASIGVVSAIPTQIDLDKLITMADESLYLAKDKGRNQVVATGNY